MAARDLDPTEMHRLEAPERMGRMPPQEVIDLLDPHPGIRCLDLGSGTGYISRPLASHLAPGGVVALDRSRAMLRELGRRSAKVGAWVPRVQADARNLPLRDGGVDRVLSLNLHHELEDPEVVLAEVHRILARGGRLVLVDWAPVESPTGPPQEHRFEEEELVEAVRDAGFDAVQAHDILPYHAAVTGEVLS